MKCPELLSPAGSLTALQAAVGAGADAVYFGGQEFNARRSAANFSLEEIAEAVKLCRLFGVKTNLTLNTMIKDSEWKALMAYVDRVLPLGIDAVIVQDLGVARYIHEHFPEVALHASTQLAIMDAEGAEYLESLGFSRIVLARELSLEDIRKVREATSAELEVFIHGALCYSYSGRCLISSFHGGRSGNRGTCSQSCRLQYEVESLDSMSNSSGKKAAALQDGRLKPQTGYFMNLKDRAVYPLLTELIEAGVDSLKIEGRMKSPAYVAGVTAFYRRRLDDYCQNGSVSEPTDQEVDVLKQLFNRGEFTSGYLKTKAGMIEKFSPKNQGLEIGRVTHSKGNSKIIETRLTLHAGDELEIRHQGQSVPLRLSQSMLMQEKRAAFMTAKKISVGDKVYRIVDPELMHSLTEAALQLKTLPVQMEIFISPKEAMKLNVKSSGFTVEAEGQTAQPALTEGLTEATVREKLSRTGGTAFHVENPETDIIIHLQDRTFVRISDINVLRRQALTNLQEAMSCPRAIVKRDEPELIEAKRLDALHGDSDSDRKTKLEIELQNPIQLEAAMRVLKQETPRVPVTLVLALAGFAGKNPKALLAQTEGFQIRILLPPLSSCGRLKEQEALVDSLAAAGLTEFEAATLGQFAMIKRKGFSAFASPEMGVFNTKAAEFLEEETEGYFISRELTDGERKNIEKLPHSARVIYGRVPYMVSEQCLYKEAFGCHPRKEGHLSQVTEKTGIEAFKTEQGSEKMLLRSYCPNCMTVLYSEKPVALPRVMLQSRMNQRIIFTTESAGDVRSVLNYYLGASPKIPDGTEGHERKGVT